MVMRTLSRLVSVMVCVASLAGTSACDDDAATEPATGAPVETAADGASAMATVQGDPAVWVLRPGEDLQRSSTRFTAVVSRLDCNDGVTGQILAPAIRTSES